MARCWTASLPMRAHPRSRSRCERSEHAVTRTFPGPAERGVPVGGSVRGSVDLGADDARSWLVPPDVHPTCTRTFRGTANEEKVKNPQTSLRRGDGGTSK